MMKLAIVFLPIVFAVIWMLFIGLRINKRDENKKLITNWLTVDLKLKTTSFFLMSCSVTSVFTFKIESTFDEWAAIFDSAEADKRHSEFDIKPLFRGVSKEDPQKIIVIHQAPEGNVQKFVEANGDWMATHRVDLSTMEDTSWTASLTKDDCCD